MPQELVDSRLDIPPLPPRHVPRPRLLAALDAARDVPLVLLSAGPGTGKTVLLAEWARRSRLRVAWLCPAAADNDPARLRALLESALRVPGELRVPDDRSAMPPPVPPQETVPPQERVPPQDRLVDFVHSLRGRLPAGQAPVILAIDDAHVLTDPRATDLLEVLVRRGHPRLHVVLAARRDPALPLHRYRLAGRLRELRTADLAMTTGETREMLAAHGVALPLSALSALAARTEGWAAGVRLAAMHMEHAPSPAAVAGELSFGHGGAGEYLVAEVLDRQPAPLRRILIETSFLEEVTRPLAEAVTGLDGAGEMLAEFARDNSFVVTLDPAATRFRYHRLFAEVLRYLLARDGKHDLAELTARAAACLASEGEAERALYWAARSGDGRRAAAVLVRGGLSHAFARNRAIPCAELADILPTAPGSGGPPSSPRGGGAADAEVTLATTAVRAATADARTAARELAAFQDTANSGGAATGDQPGGDAVREARALVQLMLGMRSGDLLAVDEAAFSLTGNSARKRSPGEQPPGGHPPPDLRGAVLLAQASAHFWHGEQDVDELLGQALAEARREASAGLAAEVLGMIACVASYSGRPRHADEAALRARRLLRGEAGLDGQAGPQGQARLRTPLSLRLAVIVRSVQKADLATAARHLRRVAADAPVSAAISTVISADPGLTAACTLWRATVLERAGRPHEAQGVLQAAADSPLPLPLLEAYRDVILGGIDVRLGRPEAALRRLEPHRDGGFAAMADVACAHAYLALDDNNGARQSIRRVLTAASSQSGRDVLVEAMLLAARVAQRERDTGRALEMITNALDVARTDLVLPFAAAREAFAGLLARHPGVAGRWPAPPALPALEDAERQRPVSLTQREQSVLAYLATSMTAAEIAAELYVSVNTVKTHLAAIYRKLSAGGRRDAVRRARELELLLGGRLPADGLLLLSALLPVQHRLRRPGQAWRNPRGRRRVFGSLAGVEGGCGIVDARQIVVDGHRVPFSSCPPQLAGSSPSSAVRAPVQPGGGMMAAQAAAPWSMP